MIDILTRLKLVYTWFGAGIAVGGEGEKADIVQFFDGLYNFGGHDQSETSFLSERFGYVLTTKEAAKRGLAAAYVAAHNIGGETPEGVEARAVAFAEELVDGIKSENFLAKERQQDEEYQMPKFAN